jgi:hypothetical protein
VFALNGRTQLLFGQVVGASGLYDFKVQAQSGDFITLWYTHETKQSTSVGFSVPNADGSSSNGTGGSAGAGSGQ